MRMQWIQQLLIVEMIGSDAKNRFRDIVSSKVVKEWDECEYSRGGRKTISAVLNIEVILDNIAG
jgi:hypothetical protein